MSGRKSYDLLRRGDVYDVAPLRGGSYTMVNVYRSGHTKTFRSLRDVRDFAHRNGYQLKQQQT